MKELSSPLTFFYKYVFILLWLVGFAAGTNGILLAGPAEPRWGQYLIIWIVIALCIFFSCGHVKKVTLKGKKLQISNFLKTVEIDVADIASVDGSSFLSPRLVWFQLRTPCAFGSKITFLPAHRKARGIGKHPLVQELARELNI